MTFTLDKLSQRIREFRQFTAKGLAAEKVPTIIYLDRREFNDLSTDPEFADAMGAARMEAAMSGIEAAHVLKIIVHQAIVYIDPA